MRVDPAEYARLDLRAHSLLDDTPVHDVWAVDLPASGGARSILDLREILSVEHLARINLAVRFLFALRSGLGRIFGWDREPAVPTTPSRARRLSEEERAGSLVAPGTPDGPFQVVFVTPRESISEVRNATVHAFSVFALQEIAGGERLYWAIHVAPVGRITGMYMRLIDPFRRFIIYPAVLRYIRRAWGPQ